MGARLDPLQMKVEPALSFGQNFRKAAPLLLPLLSAELLG